MTGRTALILITPMMMNEMNITERILDICCSGIGSRVTRRFVMKMDPRTKAMTTETTIRSRLYAGLAKKKDKQPGILKRDKSMTFGELTYANKWSEVSLRANSTAFGAMRRTYC